MFGKFILALASCFLCGCANFEMAAIPRDKPSNVTPELVADLPPGSEVKIVDMMDHEIVGTVLSAGRDGVALMNCLCVDSVRVPNRGNSTQVTTRHIPVRWVSTKLMASARVTAPPPPDFVPPDLDIDAYETLLVEIVDEKGHREQLGSKAEDGSLSVAPFPQGSFKAAVH